MKNFYLNLKDSTKCYLFGLISGLLGLIYISPDTFNSPSTMKLMALLNVIFAVFKILSIILLVVGAYKSYREFKKEKSSQYKKLEKKAWFRFAKVTWFVIYFVILIYIIGTYANTTTDFLFVFVYIFAMRLVKYLFYYIVLGNKAKAIE
jgi:multisubunit Na+/H+ antiporter MnhG subunit